MKPNYKNGWTIPGGQIEPDGESPWEECRRETREECGLEVAQGRLVCVDFLRPKPNRPGGVRFLFDCGTFTDRQLSAIRVQDGEIDEHRFVGLPEAIAMLSGPGRTPRSCSRRCKVVRLSRGWSSRPRRGWLTERRESSPMPIDQPDAQAADQRVSPPNALRTTAPGDPSDGAAISRRGGQRCFVGTCAVTAGVGVGERSRLERPGRLGVARWTRLMCRPGARGADGRRGALWRCGAGGWWSRAGRRRWLGASRQIR
jgi:8-oxo-dGTP diphosphatase